MICNIKTRFKLFFFFLVRIVIVGKKERNKRLLTTKKVNNPSLLVCQNFYCSKNRLLRIENRKQLSYCDAEFAMNKKRNMVLLCSQRDIYKFREKKWIRIISWYHLLVIYP